MVITVLLMLNNRVIGKTGLQNAFPMSLPISNLPDEAMNKQKGEQDTREGKHKETNSRKMRDGE
jgi:hypothetical protein